MWGMFLFDAVLGALLVAGWYFAWREVNRLRAANVLRCIEQAVAGKALVSAPRWRRASHFEVELRFASAFHDSWLSVELLPREMPLHWFLARLRKQPEQVTFRAELEHRPANNLIIANQKWYGRTSAAAAIPEQCYSLGALVITTREDWQTDTVTVERILAARSCDLIQVEFRKTSPQLLVTAPLASVVQSQAEQGLFGLLQELATCVTARKE